MREPAYHRLVSRIERDPLFAALLRPPDGRPALRRFPFAGAGFHWKPVFEAPRASDGWGELLARHRRAVELIQKLGPERYESQFLGDGAGAVPEGLTARQAAEVRAFTDAFLLSAEASPPPADPRAPWHDVAAIELDGGGLAVRYLRASEARGRYLVDRQRLEALRATLAPARRRRLASLLQWIDVVNRKRSTLHRLLEAIVETQGDYLLGGDPDKLRPLSQSEAAARLGVSKSTVSRAVRGRGLRTPAGRSEPLSTFFPGPRPDALRKLKTVLGERPGATDRELREALAARFGLFLSRRSVNRYRKLAASA